MNLMYNNGTDMPIARPELIMLPTPARQGPQHRPVPFGEFVEMVDHSLGMAGVQIMQEEFAVTKDHQRMFGMMEIAPKALEGEYIPANDWRLTLGLRGAHDMSIARGITIGTQVMVCSNLCFHAYLGTYTTRQTTFIMDRLPGLVNLAIEQVPEMMEQQKEKFDAYKAFEMNRWQGDARLAEIYRRGGLSGAQLGKAVTEWGNPSHAEHMEYGHSAWRLLNACTEAVKPTGERVNMELVRNRTMITSEYLDGIVTH
jgi:hypothetical protein